MNIKEKTKKIWEDHKCFICYSAGVVVAAGGILAVQKILGKDGVTFVKMKKPMFSIEMPISEIKEALSKMDGVVFYDSLVATINGATRLYIRPVG